MRSIRNNQERTTPRISVNKLGEYLTATPSRRRRIIMDQKRPSNFIVTRYRNAIDPIINFLINGANDYSIIDQSLYDLMEREVTSDFQEQDRDLSIEAIESFIELTDEYEFEGIEYNVPSENVIINISGVDVSVKPDLIQLNSTSNIGLLKLYFVKRNPLTETSGSYIGTVLHQYAMQNMEDTSNIDFRLCQTVDIFAKNVYTAPRTYIRRQNDIEAACQEIASVWPTV